MIRPLPLILLALPLLAAPATAQSLKGSRASVERMYHHALASDLHFYDSGAGVRRAVGDGALVRLTSGADYRLASVSYAYVLPSTRTFVERLASQYRAACGERLVVTSGIRPRSMRLVNSVDESVHPTGMAVDLRKPARSACLSWLRRTLSAIEADGRIEATEEHHPPHFHVAVFPEHYGRRAPATRTASKNSSAKVASAKSQAGHHTHRVRPGESIWAIARRANTSVERIKEANNLSSSRILVGQTLLIPTTR
jgi:LysM repeat protein